MNLLDATIQELEYLLLAIEAECMISAEIAMRLEIWHERVKEALNTLYNDAYENYTDDYDYNELFI